MAASHLEHLRERLIRAYEGLVADSECGPAWQRDGRLCAALARLLEDPESELDSDSEPDLDSDSSADPEVECTRPATADRVDRYFSGDLAPAAAEALFAHLPDCPACRARYQLLWDEEGGGEKRRKRLFRGLPWPTTAELEPDADPELGDPEGQEAAVEEAAAHAAGRRRGWFTPKRLVLVAAAALAVVGLVGMLRLDIGKGSRQESDTPPVLDPDGALTLSLFRLDTSGRYEEPWRTVMGEVAVGERLMATLSYDHQAPFHLVVVMIDDQDRLRWLAPAGGPKTGHDRGLRLAGPVKAARLKGEVKVPDGARRLVVYAVVTARPVSLVRVVMALGRAREAADFFTRPPRLELPLGLQARRALDVLP